MAAKAEIPRYLPANFPPGTALMSQNKWRGDAKPYAHLLFLMY
jgi:hypothetical protein